MLIALKLLSKLLTQKPNLDQYVESKLPKSIYDVERITRDYYYRKGW